MSLISFLHNLVPWLISQRFRMLSQLKHICYTSKHMLTSSTLLILLSKVSYTNYPILCPINPSFSIRFSSEQPNIKYEHQLLADISKCHGLPLLALNSDSNESEVLVRLHYMHPCEQKEQPLPWLHESDHSSRTYAEEKSGVIPTGGEIKIKNDSNLYRVSIPAGNWWLQLPLRTQYRENGKDISISRQTLSYKRQCSQGWSLTVSIGVVSKPQAKNSRKITTTAWYTLGSPIPCRCKTKLLVKKICTSWSGINTLGWELKCQLWLKLCPSICSSIPPRVTPSVSTNPYLSYKANWFLSFLPLRRPDIFDIIKPSLKRT